MSAGWERERNARVDVDGRRGSLGSFRKAEWIGYLPIFYGFLSRLVVDDSGSIQPVVFFFLFFFLNLFGTNKLFLLDERKFNWISSRVR